MAEETNIIEGRYQCHLSNHQWLAAVTLLLNPPFGSISVFLWLKSRQSLLAGKSDESSRRSYLSLVSSVCGLLCTLLILVLVVLALSGVIAPPSPFNFNSNQHHSTLKHQIQNYQTFRERFYNAPLPKEPKNGTELSELFENAFL